MNLPRIMISAAGSGSGKTLVTCALLALLKKNGKTLKAFKCGPDYIDPLFHREVLGISSKNLDPYFTGEELTNALFLEDAQGADLSVIEGVMGLYDGLGGIREEASSYHLARILKSPVIMVINAHGMGRSLIPLIAGFLEFDTAHLIKGVLLNRTGKAFYERIKPEIEERLPVTMFGYLPEREELHLESRHLGLKLPGEIKGLAEQISKAAEILKETVDIEAILKISGQASPVGASDVPETYFEKASGTGRNRKRIPIAIAQDAAFCFYYEDNKRLLKKLGAELIPFSPLRDKKLPEGVRGMILGGGYPELYLPELEDNESLKSEIRNSISRGMPSLAECGGFMYLHDSIQGMDGKDYRMTGIWKGSCRYTGKLVRFGYARMFEKDSIFLKPGEGIKGHEFHYFDSTDNGRSCTAKKPVTGQKWECIHTGREHWFGFPHLYYYSNPHFAEYFMERASVYEI